MQDPPVKILVVDDHHVFVTSLARALNDEPDIDVVAAVTTIDDALRHADADAIDVVLSDYRLGVGDGVQLTHALLERHPEMAVVILTASSDEAVLASALEAGCSGFITKAEPIESVIAAVRGAAVGEAVITPSLLARLTSRPKVRNPDLTEHEREVLQLVAAGMTNQQIADHLTVAVDTARNHVQSILIKLGVHSKPQATATVQRGLVTPSSD